MIQTNSGRKIYIILDENRRVDTKKTIQNETKVALIRSLRES